MELSINANVCDMDTEKYSKILYEPFIKLSAELSKNHGGIIEHLWIDFELSKFATNKRAPYSFRFQKKVSGQSNLTGLTQPDKLNVGHYSVKPDFGLLADKSDKEVVAYALALIYESTNVLIEKQNKLGAFDVTLFRKSFSDWCINNNYELVAVTSC